MQVMSCFHLDMAVSDVPECSAWPPTRTVSEGRSCRCMFKQQLVILQLHACIFSNANRACFTADMNRSPMNAMPHPDMVTTGMVAVC